MLLVISRLFFSKKADEIKSSGFRIRHLWLFSSVFALLASALQVCLFSLNYYSNNALGMIHFDPFLMGMVLGGIFSAVVCVDWLKKKIHWTMAQIGFVKPNFWYLFVIPVVIAGGAVLLDLGWEHVLSKWFYFSMPEHPLQRIIEQFMFQGTWTQKALLVAFLTVVVPFAEEVFFRIFLFRYAQQFTNTAMGVILSALVFASGHQMLLWVPYYFVFAVALNVLYLRSKSIIPCIIVHSLANLSGFILL